MRVFPSIVLTLFFALAAAGQIAGQTAGLSGLVTDSAGAVVPGTQVTATAKDGKQFRDRTNSLGVYAIRLPGGTYRIEFKMANCDGFVVPEYVIGSETEAMLDAEIPLQTCKVIACPELFSDAPPVDSRANILLPGSPVAVRPLAELPAAAPRAEKKKKKKSSRM